MQTGSRDRVDRRLAAILAADVVGYSRLMEADEAGTARLLREHRAAALIAEHGVRAQGTHRSPRKSLVARASPTACGRTALPEKSDSGRA